MLYINQSFIEEQNDVNKLVKKCYEALDKRYETLDRSYETLEKTKCYETLDRSYLIIDCIQPLTC